MATAEDFEQAVSTALANPFLNFIGDKIECVINAVDGVESDAFLKLSDLHQAFNMWHVENYTPKKFSRVAVEQEFSKVFGPVSFVLQCKGWKGYRLVAKN